jgi:hypothetical protein
MSGQPLQIPSHASLTPAMQTELTGALVDSGAIPRIHESLAASLEASGWTTNIRAYILHLLRSGDYKSYNELLRKVMEEAKPREAISGAAGKEGAKVNGDAKGKKKGAAKANGVTNGKVNGDAGDSSTPLPISTIDEASVRVPEQALRAGIKSVRKELGEICEVVFEDE